MNSVEQTAFSVKQYGFHTRFVVGLSLEIMKHEVSITNLLLLMDVEGSKTGNLAHQMREYYNAQVFS